MADHIWTVLCGKTLVDPDSKVISLIDVVESLAVAGLEKLLEAASQTGSKGALVNGTMKLVSWWLKSDPDEEVLHLRFAILSPTGQRLHMQLVDAPWGENKIFSRVWINFEQIPVAKPGLCWIIVEQLKVSKNNKSRWVAVTKLPLHVTAA